MQSHLTVEFNQNIPALNVDAIYDVAGNENYGACSISYIYVRKITYER